MVVLEPSPEAERPLAAWQDAILASVPSGIDTVQLERFLRLSPTERLEQMRQLLLQLDEARIERGHRLPSAP